MYHSFRLTKGVDLKKEIEKYAINNKSSGVILCSVGCLSKLTLRLADGKSILEKDGMFEIVSTTGTLSEDGVHIHISVSDEFGNTTAEVVLKIFEDIKFKREYDEKTGYDELVVK